MSRLICDGMRLEINPTGLRHNIDNINISLHNRLYDTHTNKFKVSINDIVEPVYTVENSTHILIEIIANGITDIVVYPTYTYSVDRVGKYRTISRCRGIRDNGEEYTVITAVFDTNLSPL